MIVVVGVVVVVGRCDNSGTSFNWHFSVKPKSAIKLSLGGGKDGSAQPGFLLMINLE